MKKKRSSTDRGLNLLDSIDLEIMEKLSYKNLGVMELKEKIGLNHQNLKPHLDKLRTADLIKGSRKRSKIELSLMGGNLSNQTINLLKKIKKSRKK